MRGGGSGAAEAVGVGRLPAPGVDAGVGHGAGGAPAEQLAGQRGIAVGDRGVAGTAGPIRYGIGRPTASDAAATTSSTEDPVPVPRLIGVHPSSLASAQRGEVALGEVDDVDVVADAGAVGVA